MNRSLIVAAVSLLLAGCNSQTPDQLSSQADNLIAGGNYKKSLKLYDQAIDQSGKDSALFAKRGTVKALLMDYDGALDDLNRAIELRSNVGWYYSKRAMILGELRQANEAIESANKAMKLDPSDMQTLAYRAKGYALNGEYENALQDANQAVQHGRDLVYSYKIQAECYIHLDRPDDALDTIKKANELNQNEPSLNCLKCEAEMLKLDLKQAEQTALIAQQKNPEAIEPYSCLARTYLLLGDFPRAKENIDIVSRKAPLDGQALLTMYYMNTHRIDKALDSAVLVAREHPSPESQMTLAEVYTVSGKAEEALKIGDGLVNEYPDLAPAYRTRALALIGLGRYDEAASAASKSIEILKYNPFAYRLRSEALARKGESDKAQEDLIESEKLGYRDTLPQEALLSKLKRHLAKDQSSSVEQM